MAGKSRDDEDSKTSRHAAEGNDTTGEEGGGDGGWARSQRVKPETRKREPHPPEDKPQTQKD